MHIAHIPRKEDLLTKETEITKKFDKWYYPAEEFFNVDEVGKLLQSCLVKPIWSAFGGS